VGKCCRVIRLTRKPWPLFGFFALASVALMYLRMEFSPRSADNHRSIQLSLLTKINAGVVYSQSQMLPFS
jgi:uncharacterized membrane protein